MQSFFVLQNQTMAMQNCWSNSGFHVYGKKLISQQAVPVIVLGNIMELYVYTLNVRLYIVLSQVAWNSGPLWLYISDRINSNIFNLNSSFSLFTTLSLHQSAICLLILHRSTYSRLIDSILCLSYFHISGRWFELGLPYYTTYASFSHPFLHCVHYNFWKVFSHLLSLLHYQVHYLFY